MIPRIKKKVIKGVRYPGEAIHWWLKEHTLNQAWLSRVMNRPEKTISEIMSYKSIMSATTAMEVEKVTGISAAFLLKLQNNLDLDKASGIFTKYS